MKSILYISLIDWHFAKQRPQHLAELLSNEYNLFYICQMPIIINGINSRKINPTLKQRKFKNKQNMVIERRVMIPGSRFKLVNSINQNLFKNYIMELCNKNSFDIIWLTHPQQLSLIPEGFKGSLIYDCMDNYAEFSRNTEERNEINKTEEQLCRKANIIFASSNGLVKKVSSYLQPKDSSKITLIQNAVDFKHFNIAYNKNHNDGKAIGTRDRKNVGYFGTIGNWFDIELLVDTAKKMPEMDFIVIGPIGNWELINQSKNINNIKILGPKPFEELPDYLKRFDVCIMPFKVNSLIQDVNPVKIYEYLAAGKPTVATKYEELNVFQDNIYLAKDSNEFVGKIKDALNEDSTELSLKRIEFASQHTWKEKGKKIKKMIDSIT